MIDLARRRIADPRIAFQVIEPEKPLPFPDASFDVVFTKDAWLHVVDKPALLREVHRVLKPGGQLAGGDWMKGPEAFSADMLYFIELEGIPYHPTTLAEYGILLHEIGFEDVKLQDINAWYRDLAQQELTRLKGELFGLMTEKLGVEARDHFIEDWRMLTVVLDKGELRPGRLWARKP
jgi:phosphoethanolamine N-methyltransferase